MPLLQSHGQWSEPILRGQRLTCSTGQEEPDYVIMVLLSCHVQWGEPILRLNIDTGGVSQQNLHHFKLTSQGGNVESSVAFLSSSINLSSSVKQILYDHYM